MKRDMDLIRDLLLKIEGGQRAFEALSSNVAEMLRVPLKAPMTDDEADRLSGHLDLLEEAGFIEIETQGGGGLYHVRRLTWRGHEYLDTVRDPETWKKTKEGANAVKSWSVDTLKEIAKGLVKKQIEEYTGVKL
jgi:DNA-binding transcriptional ArsR family regulator